MRTKEPQNAISIKNILSEDIYSIPIYQRNYEWDKPQISKLIDDIDGASNNYYLGTLVTAKKDGAFELIDGQQRHTTLNLIKAVLEEKGKEFNLKFDARKECNVFFENLKNTGGNDLYENSQSKNLNNGIAIIKDVFLEKSISLDKFKDRFYNNTYIFRTELPEETDLNHYFEIMNNRGEQLENHEILKAQLMNAFSQEPQKSEAFSEIWDACAYMGDYIWRNFKKEQLENLEVKNSLKLENWTIINKKQESVETSSNNQIYNSQNLISSIIIKHQLNDDFTQQEQEKTHKYRSVVDFSTFLLYVLTILNKSAEVSFDDKKLLVTFDKEKENPAPTKMFSASFSETFIKELLRLRFYFDKYIIKQDLSSENNDKEKWGIRGFKFKENSFQTEEKTFENADYWEDKIEMFQAMFYYASVSNSKKDWLLNILKDNNKDAGQLYCCIFKHFKNEINELKIVELKYHVTTKVFYYFEYMLWEYYYDFLRGGHKNDEKNYGNVEYLNEKINKNLSLFSSFRFRQLNSQEHLLSQDKFIKLKESLNVDENDLDYFKNLCLISTNENSSASNDNHFEKKQRFKSNNLSLKRLMMFERFDNDIWGKIEMNNHQVDMQNLLDFYKNKQSEQF